MYRDGIYTISELYMGMLKGHESGFNRNGDELTRLCLTLHQINFLVDVYVKVQMGWFGGEGLATALPSTHGAAASATGFLSTPDHLQRPGTSQTRGF